MALQVIGEIGRNQSPSKPKPSAPSNTFWTGNFEIAIPAQEAGMAIAVFWMGTEPPGYTWIDESGEHSLPWFAGEIYIRGASRHRMGSPTGEAYEHGCTLIRFGQATDAGTLRIGYPFGVTHENHLSAIVLQCKGILDVDYDYLGNGPWTWYRFTVGSILAGTYEIGTLPFARAIDNSSDLYPPVPNIATFMPGLANGIEGPDQLTATEHELYLGSVAAIAASDGNFPPTVGNISSFAYTPGAGWSATDPYLAPDISGISGFPNIPGVLWGTWRILSTIDYHTLQGSLSDGGDELGAWGISWLSIAGEPPDDATRRNGPEIIHTEDGFTYVAVAAAGGIEVWRTRFARPPWQLVAAATNVAGDAEPSMAHDPYRDQVHLLLVRDGAIYATWTQDDGATWEVPTVAFGDIAGDGLEFRHPEIRIDPEEGRGARACYVQNGEIGEIWLQQRDSGSIAWSASLRVADTAGQALEFEDEGFALSWAPDTQERLLAVWQIAGESGFSCWESLDGGATWSRAS